MEAVFGRGKERAQRRKGRGEGGKGGGGGGLPSWLGVMFSCWPQRQRGQEGVFLRMENWKCTTPACTAKGGPCSNSV